MSIIFNFWLILVSCSFISESRAYEMGPMDVLSSINEPFEAHISLLGGGDYDKNPIIVSMASKIDFMRHRTRRGYYVSDMTMSFKKNPQGQPFISIWSRHPMVSSSLDLLVMMLSSNGKKLGKYNVVLPLARTAKTQTVIAKNTMLTKEAYEKALAKVSVIADEKKKIASINKKPSRYRNNNSYKIILGDSISHIAMSLIQHYPQFKTWQLLMENLINTNDHAFFNSDHNRLKVGSILTLPKLYEQKQEKKTLTLSKLVDKPHSSNITKVLKLKKRNSKKHVDKKTVGLTKSKLQEKENLLKITTKNNNHLASIDRWKKHKAGLFITKSFVDDNLSYKTLKTMGIKDNNADTYNPQGIHSGYMLDL